MSANISPLGPTWSPPRDYRAGQLVLLAVLATSAFYARTMLGPLQETMRVQLGFDDNQMALLQGPPLAIGVLAAIPLGVLVDRRVRAPLILAFAMLGLLASWLAASVSDFALLFLARCATGISAAAIWTAVLSVLADWYPPAQRGRAMVVVSIGATLGMSSAFAAGGALVAMFQPSPDSWRWALLSSSAPLVVAPLLLLAFREPPRAAEPVGALSRAIHQQVWQHRAVLAPLVIGLALVGGIADGAAVIWAAPMLSRSFELSVDQVGLLVGVVLFTNGLLGPLLGGTLADFGQRTGGPRRTVKLLSGLLAVGIPVGCFGIVNNVSSAAVMLTLFLVIGTSFQVAVQALTTIVVPRELRATCLALMLATTLLFAFGFAPLVVSQLSTVLGGSDRIGEALAIVSVSSSICGTIAMAITTRRFPEAGPPVRDARDGTLNLRS